MPLYVRCMNIEGVKRSSTAAGGPAAKSSKTENLPPESDPGLFVLHYFTLLLIMF